MVNCFEIHLFDKYINVNRKSLYIEPMKIFSRLGFFLFTTLVGSLQTVAQTPSASWMPEMEWSESKKLARKDPSPIFAAADSQFVYIVPDAYFPVISKPEKSMKDAKVTMEVYERDGMKLAREETFELPQIPGHELQFNRLILFNGQLLGVMKAYDKENKMLRSYMFPVLLGGETGAPIFIAEQSMSNTKVSWFSFPKLFEYKVSNNDRFLLIQGPKVEGRYSFRAFDAGLEIHWQKELELPESSEKRRVESYCVDQQGYLHMLVKQGGTQSPYPSDESETSPKYFVISYDPFNYSMNEIELNLDGKYISGKAFDFAANNDLVIAGFYGFFPKKRSSRVGRYFLLPS